MIARDPSDMLRPSADHTAPCACGGWLRMTSNLLGVTLEVCDRCGYRAAVPRVVGTPGRVRKVGAPCVVCGEPTPPARERGEKPRRTCSDACHAELLGNLAARTHKRRRAAA